jgi:hypothetical protein
VIYNFSCNIFAYEIESLCSVRALEIDNQIVLNNEYCLIEMDKLESLQINLLDYNEIYLLSQEKYTEDEEKIGMIQNNRHDTK